MKVVLLAGQGDSTWIVANALKKHVSLANVIVENPPAFMQKIKFRLKRLGAIEVFGQLLFLVYAKFQRKISSDRVQAILKENNLETSVPEDIDIINVASANSETTMQILQRMNPDVVVVNGTRILSKQLLECVSATFINMHAGITPKYRGVHGAYWALASNDSKNAGVTIHMVDQGVDTGNIIYQGYIKPTVQDNYSTYPYLQIAQGVPLLVRAVNDILENHIETKDGKLPSCLHYHPTIWGYIYMRCMKGIK